MSNNIKADEQSCRQTIKANFGKPEGAKLQGLRQNIFAMPASYRKEDESDEESVRFPNARGSDSHGICCHCSETVDLVIS